MTVKTFSITSDLASVEFNPAAPVCFVRGNESDYVLDLVREIIGNNPYSTPDLIDDGSFVIHADVEMDCKNFALCYLRNADYVGDCRIAANFQPNSIKFSVDDTEEYLRKTSERNNDYSNIFDGTAEKTDDEILSESDRILAAFEKFIVQCENKANDDRPIFIYKLFDRLDESIDVTSYFDKLSALGRQVFVAVCAGYPIEKLNHPGVQIVETEADDDEDKEQGSPYVFFGKINSGKTSKIDEVFSSLSQVCPSNEIVKMNARTLCNEFIDALKNGTVHQWRANMIVKKHILIDDFHYLSEKTSTCEALMDIFKSTSATIVLAMNNHPNFYHFDEDMSRFLLTGTLTPLCKQKVDIFSKEAIGEKLKENALADKAVISFFTPRKQMTDEPRVDYSGMCDRVFYVGIPDIDRDYLKMGGYTYESYLAEADDLAKFIYEARNDGLDIICQCDYGQSRSAACAAAILEHFERRGIEIFADYRYYPNQLVYHKVFDALERQREK